MKNTYYHSKKDCFSSIGPIKFVQIFFDNGDYFPIYHTEVISKHFEYYDRLVAYDNGYVQKARSGKMHLKFKKTYGGCYDDYLLSNDYNIRKDRPSVLEKRLIEDGGITALRFFDDDNWSYLIVGNFKAKKENDEIIIEAYPNLIDEPYDSDNFFINLQPIKTKQIEKIYLSFENCEFFEVFNDEIVSVDLKFNNELNDIEGLMHREIIGGTIILNITESKDYRKEELFLGSDRKTYPCDLRNRLTGKKGRDLINLCHLYITYDYAGFGLNREEKIEILDTRPDEIQEAVDQAYDYDEEYDGPYEYFIGGIAERLDGKKVKVTFGVFENI